MIKHFCVSKIFEWNNDLVKVIFASDLIVRVVSSSVNILYEVTVGLSINTYRFGFGRNIVLPNSLGKTIHVTVHGITRVVYEIRYCVLTIEKCAGNNNTIIIQLDFFTYHNEFYVTVN